MKRLTPLVGLTLALILAGCGGGGGDSAPSTSQHQVNTPAPTITASFAKSTASIGTPVVLTWSSTNATSCTASGAWSGVQLLSGSLTVTPAVGGQAKYTLTCSGAGGSTATDVVLATPIPVQASSYLNAKNLNIDSQTLPNPFSGFKFNYIEPGERATSGVAMADFFQDGSLSLVVFTNNFVPVTDPLYSKAVGHAYFFKKVGNGWVDSTALVMKDQTGCITPRKVLVADFNGDGRPDVFASCSGVDLAAGGGEQPRFLMSQVDGSYKNVAAPVICYCHGAAAAEMNKKGYADIVATDTRPFQKPFMLINDGQGNFSVDKTRFSNELDPFDAAGSARPIYTVDMIDFNNTGKFDIIFAGAETGDATWSTTILHNPGNNVFVNSNKTILPKNEQYGLVLDVVFDGGYIYLNRTTNSSIASLTYQGTGIQKIAYPSLVSTMIYTHGADYPNKAPNIDWIMPYKDRMVSFDSGFALNIVR